MPFGKELFKAVDRITNEIGRWERQAAAVREVVNDPESSKIIKNVGLAIKDPSKISSGLLAESGNISAATNAIEELCHKFYLLYLDNKPLLSVPLRVLNYPQQHLKYLGKGSFGTAYAYTDTVLDITIALKQVPLPSEGSSDQEVEAVRKEVDLHSKLLHKNVVQYIGYSEVSNYLYIAMEFMEGSSLRNQLNIVDISSHLPNTPVLPEEIIRKYTHNIINGLIYLHSNQIIHRDLRSSNVLISADNIAKIADFGISKQLTNLSSKSGFTTMVGNVFWQSPEMIQAKPNEVGRRVDVWSLGITILEMIYCLPPFFNKYDHTQYMFALCIRKEIPEIPDFIGQDLKEVLQKCIVFDVKQRAHSKDLLIWS